MLTELQKAPFPYFGGKRQAAPRIWSLLGDPAHYCEPFCGSAAVLLERPHPCNRPYYSETINDLNGFVVNALRAMAFHPQATAEAASWYVSEACLTARHLALLRWQDEQPLERLMADPTWCDPQIGGMWLWGLSCWIGSGWCSGQGPWRLDGTTGRITRQPGPAGVWRQRPHVGNDGQGVCHAGTREPGVSRQLPHVSHDGQGVCRPGMREPGVWRQRPHVGNDGQGVCRPGTREPGVSRQLPHISDDGRGVCHAGTREPGVSRQLPHIGDNGQGVCRPGTREPGVQRQFPHVGHTDAEVTALVEADYAATDGFHPMTMPELRRWFQSLSARLRHVRILHGDWTRLTTTGALKTLPVREHKGVCGIFFDPPYATEVRDPKLYTHDNTQTHNMAAAVRAWCLQHGDDPDYRIVLAGFAGEGHEVLEQHGWTVHTWFVPGHLTGGMANTGGAGTHQQHRERLWASPHCVALERPDVQLQFWGEPGAPPVP